MIVIVRLTGGLGNQLFQYAAGRALAFVRGAKLWLDTSSYENERLGREYRLDCFHVHARTINRRGAVHRSYRRLEAYLPSWWRRDVFTEKTLSFDNDLFDIQHSTELRGYWQSERYFEFIGPLLRQDLVFKKPAVGRNAELAKEIVGSRSVSIHVRRSDYVTNSSHVVLPLAYYETAIVHLSQDVPGASYYVFSDDIPWCRGNLPLSGYVAFVDHNGPEADFEDLRLMSLCQHHIIANSSFSWWGAWLADRPGQIVIAPKQWFTRQPADPASRFPLDWEVLG